ncbi:MAG: hypothetical protein ACPG4T_04895 [Nannocystaceae bacterium]
MVVYNMWALLAAMITALVYAPIVYLFGDLVDPDIRVLGFILTFGLVGTVLEFYKLSPRLFWLPVWFWGVVAIVGTILDAAGFRGIKLFGTTAGIAIVAAAILMLQARRFGLAAARQALAAVQQQASAGQRLSYRRLSQALIVEESLNEQQRLHTVECLDFVLSHFRNELSEPLQVDVEQLVGQLRSPEGDTTQVDPARIDKLKDWLNEQAAFAN